MKTLILETGTEKSCLILADGSKLLAYSSLSGGPELSRTLALSAQNLLKDFRPEAIACGSGPGSYTGVRVGAALAQGLSYGYKVPLVSFCSLAAFLPGTTPAIVLFDARSAGLYALIDNQPLLLHPSDPRLASAPHFSPHPELISARTGLPCQPAEPNPSLLAAHIHTLLQNPQPFSLCYLTDPARM